MELYTANPVRFTQPDLDDLLRWCSNNKVSDLTLKSGEVVMVRHHGRIVRLTRRPLAHAEVGEMLNIMFGPSGMAQVLGGKALDFSYDIRLDRYSRLRYRCNATSCLYDGGVGLEIAIRTIDPVPPLLENIGLEPELFEAMTRHQGMNLIVGETGSGKSTLMSAVIRRMVEEEDANLKVVTYEAPIEFIYEDVAKPAAIVTQSEIPKHLPSFEDGIRNAMRRDPDVILVGESRDAATMGAAIEAARTGHLLFTTLHSNGVASTIRRIVGMFPESDRQARTLDVVETTNIVLTQRLVPNVHGGQTAIREYLVWTDEIRDLLLNTETERIPSVLRDLTRKHGKTLGESAKEKFEAGIIGEKEYRKIAAIDERLDLDSARTGFSYDGGA